MPVPRMGRKRPQGRQYPPCPWILNVYVLSVAFTWWIYHRVRSWGMFVNNPVGPSPHALHAAVRDAGEGACLEALRYDACQTHLAAWGDWRRCMEQYLVSAGSTFHSFQNFITRCKAHLPSTTDSDHTAVLLEFRAVERQMRFSVDNVMSNLPVYWRVQIVGGPAMCRLASQLYATEIAAGKVIVTPLAPDNVEQARRLGRYNVLFFPRPPFWFPRSYP